MENIADQRLLLAFLVIDDEVGYGIAANSVSSIGRLDSNDIVLDDYKVSREHAVLKYSNGEFMLVDLASTHGTYVNGERIDRTGIEFGDKIEIVNHELVVCQQMPEHLSDKPLISTSKMARSLDRRLKFFGGLNEFSLITLVQFLAQEKQSGLLLLELGQRPGPRLYFLNGEITHVSDGDNLAELLTRQYHEQSLFFYFHHETHFPERTIKQPTANYLMDLCHSHDVRQVKNVEAAALIRSTRPLAATTRIEVPPIPR